MIYSGDSFISLIDLFGRIKSLEEEVRKIDTAIVTPKFVYDAIELKLKQPIQDMNAQFWFEQAEFFKNQTQDLCHKIMDKDELIKSLKEEIKELKKRHEWLVNQTPHNKRLNDQFNGGCCL